jgi:hypothetical protein
MAIIVFCTGCRSRFKVDEKHAGKSAPCPKCKATLKIPAALEEVTVHERNEFARGGRNAAGKLVLEPIARSEVRWNPKLAGMIAAASLFVLILCWVAGDLIKEHVAARLAGLLILTPPLVYAAYSFLRDDELEPYGGQELYQRVAVCTLAYVGLWSVFSIVVQRVPLAEELWLWAAVGPPFVIVGALTALACFDLDFTDGLWHYGFYVLVTMILRWASGMGWLWQIGAG